MSAIAANRLRERLGSGSGVQVRTARKYLHNAGIEVVPFGTLDRPDGLRIYYRGSLVQTYGYVSPMPPAGFVAFLYREVSGFLEDSASEEE